LKPLVSIVTPVYNGENTISETIESVLAQTFKDFEMIIVDDISTDNTKKVIEKYAKKDKRINYYSLPKKGGASAARNYAVSKANGRYIAFLDGDDLWYPEKLEKQIKFMQDNNYYFTYTDYEYIDDNSNPLNKIRKCPKKMSYHRMLLGDSVGCLTVIYDSLEVGRISIPELKKRNDYALWCVILKKVKCGYKLNEILAKYRKGDSSNSLSSGSKIKLLKYHYKVHHDINKFNPIKSFFYTTTNVFNYFMNRCIREKKKKFNNCKIGILGHFAIGKDYNDGQTVKTKNVYDLLEYNYPNQVFRVDTYNWKKHPIRLFNNCYKLIKNCDNVIFLTAKNGVKVFVPLLTFFNKKKKKNIMYVVIGGWLPEVLKGKDSLIAAAKKITHIFVETNGMLKELNRLGLHNTEILLNFKKINPIKKEDLDSSYKKSYKTCTFSRVMKEKGISDAIFAIKMANEKCDSSFSLDIYGPVDEKYQDEFDQLVSENSKYVKYCGVVESSQSVEIVKKYDLLLFPTRFDTEGLPGTIIDAFASGVPVVYSNWRYCNEFFQDEYNGIKFEMGNVESLENVLINFYNKKYDIRKLKNNCLDSAKKYDPDVAIKDLTKYLR